MLRAKAKASVKRRLFYGSSAATLERAMPPTAIAVTIDADGGVLSWTAPPGPGGVMLPEDAVDVIRVGAP